MSGVVGDGEETDSVVEVCQIGFGEGGEVDVAVERTDAG